MISTIDDIVAAYNLAWASVNSYNLYPMLRSKKDSDDPTQKQLNDFRKEYWGKLDKMTILVPAYKEQNVLNSCIKSINKSGFPKNKLEVIILLEKGDQGTIDVANKIASKCDILPPINGVGFQGGYNWLCHPYSSCFIGNCLPCGRSYIVSTGLTSRMSFGSFDRFSVKI